MNAFIDPNPLHEVYEGLHVLDLSQGIAGPYCAQILGQMGAQVTKVEPLHGDWGRSMGVPRGALQGSGNLLIGAEGGFRAVPCRADQVHRRVGECLVDDCPRGQRSRAIDRRPDQRMADVDAVAARPDQARPLQRDHFIGEYQAQKTSCDVDVTRLAITGRDQ